MPSTREIKAGAAYVELFLKDNRFTRGLRIAERRLRAFGQRASQIGKRMLLFSGAIATPLAFASRTFAGFEDQMKAVQAVTGAVGDQFDRLYDQAKRLGRTTSFTAAQVAGGMLSLGRAGFNPAEIEAAIPGVLNLARATGTDLAMAADIAAGTLRAFSLEADQMGRVTDVLVATANNSAQTMEDLGESMKYAAPIAEEYGLSLEETAKALGVLANMQIKGSMAGTTLRQAMLQLADPNVRRQLEELGIQAMDAAGNLRPLGQILAEVGAAMSQMGSAQRLSLAQALFGKRAAAGALKLAKSDFPALAEAIDNAGGVAERTAKVMDSGLGGAFRRLLSALEGVQIAVGEALSKALGGVMDKIAGLAVTIAEVIAKNKQWIIGISATVAAIAGVGAALVALGIAGQAAAFIFGGIATILSTVGAAFGLVATAIGALLTPVGALSVAVIALGGYLLKASGAGGEAIRWLGEKLSELAGEAQKAFKGISDALAAGDLKLAAQILWLTLKIQWIKGVNTLREIWIGFKKIFLDAWTDAVYGVAKIFTKAMAAVEKAMVLTGDFLVSKWYWVQKNIAKGIGWVIAKIQGLDPAEVLADIERQYGLKERARQRRTQTRLREIETERAGTLEELERDRQRKLRQREERYGQRLAQAHKELEELIRERDKAIAEAAQAAERARKGRKIDDIRNRLEEALEGLEVGPLAGGGPAAVGTFSAFAAARIGASNWQRRLLKANEETAENTREMKKKQNQNPGIPVR